MYSSSRRQLLHKGIILGAGMTAGGITHTVKAGTCKGTDYDNRWDNEYDYGHTILYHGGIPSGYFGNIRMYTRRN